MLDHTLTLPEDPEELRPEVRHFVVDFRVRWPA
jgi:hypothetical protein